MTQTFELETLKIRLNDIHLAPIALHQRIQRALRTLILDGVLSPGVKLPASRTLARSLGVARDTVENAYVQLQRDGFIQRRGGSGSYVSETLGNELRGARHRGRPRQAGPDSAASSPPELSRRGHNILAGGGVADQQRIQPFATGLPETRNFPTNVWERLQRQALKDHSASVLLHGDPQGVGPLRKAIAVYLNLERGARVTPEQILVLSSTRQALFLCAQLLADAGQPILLENPGYSGARKAFEAAGIKIVPVDVDHQGIRTELLRTLDNGAGSVYVTPSHQYPTGATLSLERRLELIHWAAERGKWIIEDDYDSEFHYQGLPTACMQGLDPYRRTIYIGTFSKTLFPGLRIGYMVLPPGLVTAFTHARSVMDGHTPQLPQLTLARFMEDGHYYAHIRAMRKLYAARRLALLNALDRHLSEVVTPLRPDGGLQIPCLLKPGWSEPVTLRQAAAAGMPLLGLSRLFASEAQRQGWLLGYAAMSEHEIETAVRRLARALTHSRA